MSKNDITGDRLISKVSNQAYQEGWERIFNAKPIEKTGTIHAGRSSQSCICEKSGHSAKCCAGVCSGGQEKEASKETA